jgi:hypothetical protein
MAYPQCTFQTVLAPTSLCEYVKWLSPSDHVGRIVDSPSMTMRLEQNVPHDILRLSGMETDDPGHPDA